MKKKLSSIIISIFVALIGLFLVMIAQTVELSHSFNDFVLSFGIALIIAVIYNIFLAEESTTRCLKVGACALVD